MTQYLIKVVLTSVLVVAVAEVSKRSSLIGGLLVSLPLVFFLALPPLLLKTRLIFFLCFGVATALMLASYGVMLVVLKKAGVNL